MSRIAGLFQFPKIPPSQDLLRNMLFRMMPRGVQPQTVISSRTFIGTIGTASLHDGERFTIAFDGTIYNSNDFPLHRTPAELMAYLCAREDVTRACARLNADFAAAVLDRQTGSFWLARDRFGLKPLYYYAEADGLAFASQPAALFEIPGVSRRPDLLFTALFAASHYRYFDNRPESSPFADIRQVPAAQAIEFRNGSSFMHRYWSLSEQPEFTEGEEALALQYHDLLKDAVRLRFSSSHASCFTLSGGLDSSSVLACAVHLSGAKQHAFSAVYPDLEYDESREIQSMLETTVAKWHAVRVETPEVLKLVGEMVEVHNEPVATATWLSHYLVCQEVKEAGFTTIFGGLGGDELNAGEYEYYFYYFADLRQASLENDLRREVEFWKKYHDHPIYRKSYEVMEQSLPAMVDLAKPGHCLAYRPRLLRYAGVLRPEFFRMETFEPLMDHPFTSYLKNRTYQDITRETLPCCVRAEDRHTTALGLSRVLPFTDPRLVEFMYRIPARLKIRNGLTKHLLRLSMRGILPEETRTRIKKTGWNAPAHQWFTSANREALMDLIRSRAFRERGIYDAEAVEKIAADHFDIVESGRAQENHMMFLWQLVNLELWFRRVVESPSPALTPHE